jgi:hypothetical protein
LLTVKVWFAAFAPWFALALMLVLFSAIAGGPATTVTETGIVNVPVPGADTKIEPVRVLGAQLADVMFTVIASASPVLVPEVGVAVSQVTLSLTL